MTLFLSQPLRWFLESCQPDAHTWHKTWNRHFKIAVSTSCVWPLFGPFRKYVRQPTVGEVSLGISHRYCTAWLSTSLMAFTHQITLRDDELWSLWLEKQRTARRREGEHKRWKILATKLRERRTGVSTYPLTESEVSPDEGERNRNAEPEKKQGHQRRKRNRCGATITPQNQVHHEEQCKHHPV